MSALPVDTVLPGARGTARPETTAPTPRARRRGVETAEEATRGAAGFEKAMRQEATRSSAPADLPEQLAAIAHAVPGRSTPPPPADAPAGAEPASRSGGDDRPARARPGSAARSAAEVGPGALLQAAAAGAGLGPRDTMPRQGQAPGSGREVPGDALGGATGANRATPDLEGGESSGGPGASEEPRRPLHEAAGLVPGWKAPALPASAAPDAGSPAIPAPARTAAGISAAGAPGPGHSIELRAQDGTGVTGAILQSAAHLRIEGLPGGIGDIELHLRVRGDVTHVRIDGEAGRIAAVNAPELATALASAGLTLGRLETPPVAAPSSSAPSGGFGEPAGPGGSHFQPPSQGQPEPHRPGEPPAPPQPRTTRDPSGRNTTRGGRVHVEA